MSRMKWETGKIVDDNFIFKSHFIQYENLPPRDTSTLAKPNTNARTDMEEEVQAQKESIRELERRLLALKWKKSENENKLGMKLYATDSKKESPASSNHQKSKWLKSVIDSELSQPLLQSKITHDEIKRLEYEQRLEYKRFDTHLIAIRNSARRSANRKKKKIRENGPLQTQSRRLKELEVCFCCCCCCFYIIFSHYLFIIQAFLLRERDRHGDSIERLVKLQKSCPV